MSEVLTVPTHFEDLGQFSDGFVDRVERDTLILYGPVPYEDGVPIEFSVLLADGSTALEGSGKVRAAVDGGADRVPETRYDVVIEGLGFEGRFEAVFDSLVITRERVSEPPTGTSGMLSEEHDGQDASVHASAQGEGAASGHREGLSRPSRSSDEDVVAAPEVPMESAASTGLFQYSGTLPIPERPPVPGQGQPPEHEAPEVNPDDFEEHE